MPVKVDVQLSELATELQLGLAVAVPSSMMVMVRRQQTIAQILIPDAETLRNKNVKLNI